MSLFNEDEKVILCAALRDWELAGNTFDGERLKNGVINEEERKRLTMYRRRSVSLLIVKIVDAEN